MMTFFGMLASIFAGVRVANLWDADASKFAGLMVIVLGTAFSVATDIGPFVAIGATIWIYRNTETSGGDQFDDLDQKSLPDPDEVSNPGTDTSPSPDGGEAADEFFDDHARTGGVTPDPEPDDTWQQQTDRETSEPDPADASPPSEPAGTDDDDGGPTDERDPYDIEW